MIDAESDVGAVLLQRREASEEWRAAAAAEAWKIRETPGTLATLPSRPPPRGKSAAEITVPSGAAAAPINSAAAERALLSAKYALFAALLLALVLMWYHQAGKKGD